MQKIYFAIFGSGLGHVTRILDISERLRNYGDSQFCYSSFDQALKYLDAHKDSSSVVESPRLDVEWTSEGSFSSRDVLPRFPFMFNSFLRQVAFEAESLVKFNPKLVVSDSRLSAVLAAWAKSYPVITMLNQFKVTLPPRFSGKLLGGIYERIAGNVLGLLWSLSDSVLMTDLPPPYTIGEANLEGTEISRIVKYVGFVSPSLGMNGERLEKARRSLSLDHRPFIFFQISGPDATKKRFVEVALQASDELSKRYNIAISMGYSGGSVEPKRLANGTWIYDWCPIKDELFLLSSLVVARSGHRTIGECIDAGKPAVLVPIHNHSEQIGNADKFRRLGLGIDLRSERMTTERLIECVDACINDSRYKENIEKIRAISEKYNGIERSVEIIKSYS